MIEIERKFLVRADAIADHKTIEEVKYIRQGYLVRNDKGSVRIRVVTDSFNDRQGYLMYKIKHGSDMINIDMDTNIPIDQAEELLENFCSREIRKTRYYVRYGKHIWHIDIFINPNPGLILGELELKSEDEVFETPPWILQEVTGDGRYYNANM